MVLSMTEGIVIALQRAASFPFYDVVMKYHSGVKDHHCPVLVYKQYVEEGKWVPYDNHADR